MKSLTSRVNLNFAPHATMKVLASLCAFGMLTSCDKKREAQDSESTVPFASARGTDRAFAPQNKTVLDTTIQEIRTVGGDWNVRNDAIRVVRDIGDRKQVEAIPSLLDGMFIIQPFSINDPADFFEIYPCSEALTKIGEPAVRHVQERFLIAKSGTEQLTLLYVLLKINGTQFTADWLSELQGMKLVPERRQRFVELRRWVLSHTN